MQGQGICLIFAILFVSSMALGRHHRYRPESSVSDAAPRDYWFNQKLDHFNPTATVTFPQRFWMNDTFSNGKSLLLAFAGEAPLDDFYGISGNILADMAAEHNMLFVYIEHRFYGQSVPNNDSSVQNLRYLTTCQALEDYVYFLQWAKSGGLKLDSDAKVITFGCSYSGMLSAFFRQKYSWLSVGAIAGSAPVLAEMDFEGYDKTVKSVLASQGSCATIVQTAFASIAQIYVKQGLAPLMTLFNTCPQSLPVVLADITSAVGGAIEGAVQGNNPDSGFPVIQLCNALKQSVRTMSPLDALVQFIKSQQGGQCLDVNSIGDIITPGAGRSWTWQTCVEYGFFQTDSVSQIFGNTIDLNFYLNICQKAFQGIGVPYPDTQTTNYKYGGLNQGQASWIIFSNGLQDPWGSNLGINKALGPTLPVTLSTSAHCAAYHKPNPADPQDLIQSRIDIRKFVAAALKRKV